MGIRISKDHLHPSVIESITSLIGDLSQLETTAKGNAVEAINELLANGGNKEELEALIAEIAEGKELIANAVGEPLTAEESFDEMSTDINSLLSTFKTNMMNNGITVESGDKFKQLIDKIATMVEEGSGKGIQFTQSVCNIYNKSNIYAIEVECDFEPDIIIAEVDYTCDVYNGVALEEGIFFIYYNKLSSETTYFDGVSTLSDGRFYKSTGITKTGNKFVFDTTTVADNSDYKYTFSNKRCYAIGVGEEDTTLRDSLASILTEEGVSVTEEDDMASLISKVDSEFDNRITMKTGTLNYTNGLVGENNNEKIIITHNLGTIPSYIICRTSVMDYMPDGSSVGRNFTGSLCLTIDNSSYITANGNEATLSITDITENTFTVLTTMGTSGRLSGWIEEWIVMK